ncbi:DUF885 domain-containing protein [Parvularcula lutaonensis]|uniref:DUF885 domain-containing protein n=1 Tax=Parvularcula lutaonensis TaxID=491923 RepID=A0ABV7M9K1_9PROT|nr:DUF885 family protein [Parvularcula lutaonensis]GGY42685.1 Tat pathway signal protein [Parvularcula lutaonensis]
MFELNLPRALLCGAASLALLAACGETETPAAEPAPKQMETGAAPEQVEETADEAFERLVDEATTASLRANPRRASYANLPEDVAGGRYKDRFETPGIAGLSERRAIEKEYLDRLRAIDPATLSPKNREGLAILLAGADAIERAYAIADEAGYFLDPDNYLSPYNITQIGGIHIDLPQFMTGGHALFTEDDVEAYIDRLDLFYDQFQGEIEIFEANAAAGVLPPDYAIDGAIANAARFIAMDPSENPLVSHLETAIEDIEIPDKDEVIQRAIGAVETSVYPAYEALLSTLRQYQDDATHDAGIWDIPRGSELYAQLVKINGETDLSPDEVHQLGKREVARIHNEMEALFEEIGMTEGDIRSRLAALATDPAQIFPNTPEGKEELLAYVRELASEAEEVMDDYFLVTPSIGFEVRPVPAYAEDGAPGGYYNSPAEDGSRPGVYYINLRDTAAQEKFSLPTLTYHEAVPGHHFQLALAVDDKDTKLAIRNAASSNGFVEGWALYSESFAEEIGLYDDDPYGNIGRLRDELFRAVRLVVDTGMHEKRWSREEAIDYMVDNAGMNPGGVATEIERYSVWPGQALAYKIGMLKIQELRAKAEEALGEDFDVGAFHYHVLRGGGAPLPILEQRIDAWIAEGGPAPEIG